MTYPGRTNRNFDGGEKSTPELTVCKEEQRVRSGAKVSLKKKATRRVWRREQKESGKFLPSRRVYTTADAAGSVARMLPHRAQSRTVPLTQGVRGFLFLY